MALQLTGALTHQSAPHWFKTATLPQDGVVDLSGVTQADSSALALLLDLRRRADAKGEKLRCIGASPQLLALARFFELDAALDLQGC